MEKLILDTNILIEILKGNESIVSFIQNSQARLYISSISKMELFFGAKDKRELKKLEEFSELFETLEINTQISQKAVTLMRQYAKSHNLNIPDALIGASAIDFNIPLYTLNIKDFKYMEELRLVEKEVYV